jgi:ParB family chromosome partitioning protein
MASFCFTGPWQPYSVPCDQRGFASGLIDPERPGTPAPALFHHERGDKKGSALFPSQAENRLSQSSALRCASFVQTCGRFGLVLIPMGFGWEHPSGFQLASPYSRTSPVGQEGRRGLPRCLYSGARSTGKGEISMTTFTTTLDKLSVSPKNVRKINAKDIDDLLASIPVHGLINKVLTVEPAEKEGYFHVIAGGRRYRALKELAKRKLIDKKFEVTCALYEGEDATGLSLAENIMRAPMHPADQFRTFSQLADTGQSIEQIASTFGTSESLIRKRLKLGRVAPAILDAFSADRISQEHVMAFAVTDDQDRQLALYKSNMDMPVWKIKEALTETDVQSSDKRVKFVGLDAYKAAGGTFYEDLFTRNGEEVFYLSDAALLDRLVAEKLDVLIEEVKAEGWQGVEVIEGYYSINDRFPGRIYPEPRVLSADKEAELERLQGEHDRLGELSEALPDDEAALKAYEEVSRQIDALTVEAFTPEQMAGAYAVILFGHNDVEVKRGLTRKQKKTSAGVSGKAVQLLDHEGHPRVSDKLQQELDCVRTVMIASDLANNPGIAIVATVHAMALKLVYSGFDAPCRISFEQSAAADHIMHASQLKPVTALAEMLEQLKAGLPADEGDWWAHFLNMDQAALLNCLAVFAGLSVQGYNTGSDARRNLDHLATALETDPANHVTLSQLALFERTPKAHILSVVEQVKGKDKAANLSTMKKAALAERATQELDGIWLPGSLSTSQTPGTSADDIALDYDNGDDSEDLNDGFDGGEMTEAAE